MAGKMPLLIFTFAFVSILHAQTAIHLVGKPAANYPHFRWVQNVSMDEALFMAIDGTMVIQYFSSKALLCMSDDRKRISENTPFEKL